ncbi:MAG: shikimate kinase [Niameybacter sp.]|uniref:shikimate kinase n=1 Tax=Niameybacter sp. TaxID=2033640 RepID=UPI002FC7266A
MKNIYLIGFMGCGKTTLASTLAKSLQREWIDLDERIVCQEQMPIAHIFEQKGEAYFRQVEAALLQEISCTSGKIISTGGGIVGDKRNQDSLKKGICIYLDWPFEELYTRIADDATRPLAKSYDQLKALYETRKPLYEASCTLHVNCTGQTPYHLKHYLIETLALK